MFGSESLVERGDDLYDPETPAGELITGKDLTWLTIERILGSTRGTRVLRFGETPREAQIPATFRGTIDPRMRVAVRRGELKLDEPGFIDQNDIVTIQ